MILPQMLAFVETFVVAETRSTCLVRIDAVLPKCQKGEYLGKSDIVFLPMIDLTPSNLS